MAQILLVEDNKMFSTLIKKRIEAKLDHKVIQAATMAEASQLLAAGKAFFIALLDLHLPDSPDGKIVDFVLSHGVPVIVFTGDFSDHIRDTVWGKGVVDYVVKEGAHNIDYIVGLIGRIYRNRDLKVLVVDDSFLPRAHVRELLEVHRYQVHEATDGVEALEILKQHPDIKLVVTDFNMPNMDGFELTKRIRATYSKEELAIIGMSTYGNQSLSAKFIKNGANDFLNKPFFKEEFYCRVTQNVELIERLEQLSHNLIHDYLTGLYNRRYLFEAGTKLLAHCERNNLNCAIAMIDLDRFKAINDCHGHLAGDEVLRRVAGVLQTRLRESDIVARLGGEEFCVLATDIRPEKCAKMFEELRQAIAAEIFDDEGRALQVTASIGVCPARAATLDEMIRTADTMLYKAKEQGRNRVVCS